MIFYPHRFLLLFLALFGLSAPTACGWLDPGPDRLFWAIGRFDRDCREFALAPDRSNQFREDGLFVVGQSDSRSDWPYVHPGPGDLWAGARPHTFTVLFGVNKLPEAGRCRLLVKILDTHRHNPPPLRVLINGQPFDRELPAGVGDPSLLGQPEKGRPFELKIDFPTHLLQKGDNEIQFTTLKGSWFIYDWIGLYAPAGLEYRPVATRNQVQEVVPLHVLQDRNGRRVQKVQFKIRHFGEPTRATLQVEGESPADVLLRKVSEAIDLSVPAVSQEKQVRVTVAAAGRPLDERLVTLKPIRPLTIFLLPHSHTDVGYTEIQTAVAKKHVDHLLKGMAYAAQTAGYPEGARFVWNVETLWAADLFLRRSSRAQQDAFVEAVRKGRVALNGMYVNALTGLCRPEELLRLFREAPRLAERTGVPIDAAMISDIPGSTWGTVTALAQAGITYYSSAPNYFDRVGDALIQWENKPFYWVSSSGKEKVLVWVPSQGYALSHLVRDLTPQFLEEYQTRLEQQGYPYDVAYIRWSAFGDNAAPDPSICEFVKNWNARHLSPRLVIASTSTAFRALEERHGSRLPRFRGDWTPYWEDGAGSTARETALNRNASDRLAQAEALWALIRPGAYPTAAFDEAWRQVLLFTEHTWGADTSISEPRGKKTSEQWEIKRSYALEADRRSRDLLALALAQRGKDDDKGPSGGAAGKSKDRESLMGVDVFNTHSWPRTDVVTLPRDFPTPGDRVVDDQGRPVPSQRLQSGELVFLAKEVPPLAGRRFRVSAGAPFVAGNARASGAMLANEMLQLRLDEKTGGIKDLRAAGIDGNLVDTSSGHTLNDYLYLRGDNPADLRRNGPVTIRVQEPGPLVASLLIESGAPGCRKLWREVRLTAGQDSVELINTVDKERLQYSSYFSREGKESVQFAFPFNVPNGQIRLDIPWAVMRPELDQIPGSCKNWLTVGRWADVTNEGFGVTWVTLDAPLVQVGGITATLLNSQTDPRVWRKRIEPTQRLYSWVMNNHWGTNYRAYQEGVAVFRYLLRPHRVFDPAEASRLAIGRSQPLIAAPAWGPAPSANPVLQLDSGQVLVAGFKPSDDGKALMFRLFGASGQTVKTRLSWREAGPRQIWLSDTSERPRQRCADSIEVPAYGLVTLRVERENPEKKYQ
jgi:alpha-mannosidase